MVTIEEEIHLFPYRTQKLSLSSPKILGVKTPGKLGRSQLKNTENFSVFFNFKFFYYYYEY